jgi:glycosyltransferase involved in cell wall biosynthesis
VPILTLYLGIYNGEKYIEGLFHQIQSQDYQDSKILVVDNNSSDGSLKLIKHWKKVYKGNIQIVKNKFNYGGHGSLIRNIDKIETPWFCTFHQDDFYKANHLSTLIDLIAASTKNTVGVSTTMGSMTKDARTIATKPRINWFSSNLDQPGQFLQNLKAQAVPYPASAFKLSIFKKTKVPFHSPTFSDTEQTLRMLGYGKFIFSQKETMLYRENPESESHRLNVDEKITGTAVALARVFHSREFNLLLDKVEKKKREKFANQVLLALNLRIKDRVLSNTIENMALEQMLIKWGYAEDGVNSLLSKNYAKTSSVQAIEVLNNLSTSPVKFEQFTNRKETTRSSNRIWDLYFKTNIVRSQSINRIILKNIYRLIFLVKPNHIFKNRWK